MKALFKFFILTVLGVLAAFAIGCASTGGAGGGQGDLGGIAIGLSHMASDASGQPDYREVISDPGRF